MCNGMRQAPNTRTVGDASLLCHPPWHHEMFHFFRVLEMFGVLGQSRIMSWQHPNPGKKNNLCSLELVAQAAFSVRAWRKNLWTQRTYARESQEICEYSNMSTNLSTNINYDKCCLSFRTFTLKFLLSPIETIHPNASSHQVQRIQCQLLGRSLHFNWSPGAKSTGGSFPWNSRGCHSSAGRDSEQSVSCMEICKSELPCLSKYARKKKYPEIPNLWVCWWCWWPALEMLNVTQPHHLPPQNSRETNKRDPKPTFCLAQTELNLQHKTQNISNVSKSVLRKSLPLFLLAIWKVWAGPRWYVEDSGREPNWSRFLRLLRCLRHLPSNHRGTRVINS